MIDFAVSAIQQTRPKRCTKSHTEQNYRTAESLAERVSGFMLHRLCRKKDATTRMKNRSKILSGIHVGNRRALTLWCPRTLSEGSSHSRPLIHDGFNMLPLNTIHRVESAMPILALSSYSTTETEDTNLPHVKNGADRASHESADDQNTLEIVRLWMRLQPSTREAILLIASHAAGDFSEENQEGAEKRLRESVS